MKRIDIYSFIVGAIFLISGFAKSIDTALFAQTIESYGLGALHYLAPCIIILEICMGLAMIFHYRLRQMALICLGFLAILTAAFLYGWLVNGITDCGCFGRLPIFSSPWATLGKNILLFYFLIDIYRNSASSNKIGEAVILTCVAAIALGAFISGFTHRYNSRSASEFKPKALSETPLVDYVTTSSDSTYLVFAFSYTCPHCLNSIANLQQYESAGIVDKVIGLAVADTINEPIFRNFFQPTFTIHNIAADSLFRLTNEFPVAYIIRNDSLLTATSGELPTALLLNPI